MVLFSNGFIEMFICLKKNCSNFTVEYMIQKLGMEESSVPELCISLYKDYGTTMAGLKVF